ncbi:MAG: universal stress protein [Haloarculaceae archaeon]
MYTILVPIDNDENRSQAQAAFVAGLPVNTGEVQVVLTHVLQGAETEAPDAMRRPDRVETVRDARDVLEDDGYDVDIVEASTPPAKGILELSEDVDADLIVMGGRKRSPTGKALFGSVTQSVILDSDVPVTVTGGKHRE